MLQPISHRYEPAVDKEKMKSIPLLLRLLRWTGGSVVRLVFELKILVVDRDELLDKHARLLDHNNGRLLVQELTLMNDPAPNATDVLG